MGTRNLTCVVLDGEIRIAQYGQWDGYPEGQGETVYAFVKDLAANPDLMEDFKLKVRALKQVDHDYVMERWKECGADDSGWVGLDISHKFSREFYHLHRDCAAEILEMVADGEAEEVFLETAFAADSLFCEWAYVVDLDRGVLEVYRGFQKKPHNKGRFAEMPVEEINEERTQPYYPIALLKAYPFNDLPETKEVYVEELNSFCDKEEDEVHG